MSGNIYMPVVAKTLRVKGHINLDDILTDIRDIFVPQLQEERHVSFY